MTIGGSVTPRTIAQREKERQALELRKEGLTYEAIAAKLGYYDKKGAERLVKKAFARLTDEPAAELRRLEAAQSAEPD